MVRTMGTMTVSVDDKVEKRFREEVKREIGEKKGALSRAVTEAFAEWAREKRQEEIAKKELKLLEKGLEMGRIKFKRKDLHGR